MQIRNALWLPALALVLSGCASNPPSVSTGQVSYGDAGAVEVLTNEFGSTDLQMMAETMSRSLLEHPAMDGRPLVVMANVRNKTNEYIDTRSITNSMKTQLMRGGVRFVTDSSTMDELVDELVRQNDSGLYRTRARAGQLQGAKYLLTGELTSIVKRNGSVKDVYYKFTMMLKDVESGIDEWQDEIEIRKTSRD